MEQNFKMINVGEKEITKRRALASGNIHMAKDIALRIKNKNTPKGDVLAMAEVAGIMAAKNTSNILPLCHPILLDSIKIWFEHHEDFITVFCEVICHGKTGVEMEALTGVSTALLSIYDLTKVMDPALRMSDTHLIVKEGGKSGIWHHPDYQKDLNSINHSSVQAQPKEKKLLNIKCANIIMSDRAARNEYSDQVGPILNDYLTQNQANIIGTFVLSDEKTLLQNKVTTLIKENQAEIILISGGTGIGPRDITPEAIREISDKELSGFGEAQRYFGSQHTPLSWLSRSSAFVINKTLIVLFPGSPKAVKQGIEAIDKLIQHTHKIINGSKHD